MLEPQLLHRPVTWLSSIFVMMLQMKKTKRIGIMAMPWSRTTFHLTQWKTKQIYSGSFYLNLLWMLWQLSWGLLILWSSCILSTKNRQDYLESQFLACKISFSVLPVLHITILADSSILYFVVVHTFPGDRLCEKITIPDQRDVAVWT